MRLTAPTFERVRLVIGHIVLNSRQMREAEVRAIEAGTAASELIRRAGQAAARRARYHVEPGATILVLCGPGNNGADGYVIAAELAHAGYAVQVARSAAPREGSGTAVAAEGWSGPVSALADADPSAADLIVDALFGTGLTRDLEGEIATLIARVNASGKPVLAVDIPSGVDADTGAIRGAAIMAVTTVTFAARKPGHLLYPGRGHCGRVEVADIGIPDEVLAAAEGDRVAANEPSLWSAAMPRPRMDGHKYDRGHAVVVSGGSAHTGAARMAARGALRGGAGLVTVVTTARALGVNAAHLTAIMLQVCDDPDAFSDLLSDDRYNAITLGPALGVGKQTRGWVTAALEADRATVLDADALTSFAGEPQTLAELIDAGREQPVVVTPHQGEFARLLSGGDPEVTAIHAAPSKLERTRAAARYLGAIVVLKGADTIIAAPDGRAAINANGSPHLATAGSGDVLGGIITALLAQHMPGFEAACAAVWMHADAARRFGPGLIAEDIPEMLPAVLRGLLGREGSGDLEPGP
jgi:hydroxyethylthiazole kinase-like uncharacterized protein yjeF